MRSLSLTILFIFCFDVKAEQIINPATGDFLKSRDLKPELFKEDYIFDPFQFKLIQDQPQMSAIKSVFNSGYNTSGAYTSYIRPECHYSRLESLVRQSYQMTSDLAQTLQNWITNCSAELSRFSTNPIVSLLNYTLVNYPLENNPKLQNVVFEYDEDKLKIRGILGLKDKKKRPLVIIRNGVYGNASETAVSKNLIMQLFDESPFHILFLGNVTGDQFIKDNGILAMGGFDEGRQFHEVIKQLSAPDSIYKPYIEDIHILGVSLGGNGALYSSLYNSYLDRNQVKSVLALCPVVNLENALNNVFAETPLGKVYSLITYNLLKNVFKYVPVLGELLPEDDNWSQAQVTNAVKEGAIRSYSKKMQKTPWDYEPFNGVRIQSEREFWDLNNFIKYSDFVTTPTLVIHAKDDFIVRSEQNADLLFAKIQNKNSHVGIMALQNGSHCAFNVSNGWPTLSVLLREFILKHSSYQEVKETKKMVIQYVKAPKKSSVLVLAKYEWLYEKDWATAKLRLTYLDKNKKDERGQATCRKSDYRFADNVFCYTSREFDVDLKSFLDLKIQAAATEFEADRITRWLNTHVIPVTDQGIIPYGTTAVPTFFKADVDFTSVGL